MWRRVVREWHNYQLSSADQKGALVCYFDFEGQLVQLDYLPLLLVFLLYVYVFLGLAVLPIDEVD